MIFFARGEIDSERLDEVLDARARARPEPRVHIVTELLLVGQPEIVAVFEAETVEDVLAFIAPYRDLATFEIFPAMSTAHTPALLKAG